MEQFLYIFGIFVFIYPICMSIIWCIGSLYFYFRRELPDLKIDPYKDKIDMGVSVIVPAHNEELHIQDTILSILKSKYAKFEILIVDDASTDKTYEKSLEIAEKYDNVKIIKLNQNKGKAMALNIGALAAKYEILLVIDADAILEPDAMIYLVRHFKYGPRVGAVTGNPKVRNRTNLIEKIQTVEYSSIIGLIKRAQRILGKVFTVSGVIVAFRKSAVFDVGLWDIDMITDDINITWKLEKRFYDIRFETQAFCWTMVPHTLKNLWHQRIRWAQGGFEVLFKHKNVWTDIRNRRFWPVYIEYITSGLWAYAFVLSLTIVILSQFIPIADVEFNWMAGWLGCLLTLMCLIQFMVAFFIDSIYEKGLYKYIFYIIWYAVFYWLLSAFAVFVACPKALFSHKKTNRIAVWNSPKRKRDHK